MERLDRGRDFFWWHHAPLSGQPWMMHHRAQQSSASRSSRAFVGFSLSLLHPAQPQHHRARHPVPPPRSLLARAQSPLRAQQAHHRYRQGQYCHSLQTSPRHDQLQMICWAERLLMSPAGSPCEKTTAPARRGPRIRNHGRLEVRKRARAHRSSPCSPCVCRQRTAYSANEEGALHAAALSSISMRYYGHL